METQTRLNCLKLVAATTYETRYTAANAKHICVLYFMLANRVDCRKNEDFWNDHTY